MNVHDINSGARRPDQLRQRGVEKVDMPKADAAAGQAADAKAASAGDSVEISDSARAASAQENELKREVEFVLLHRTPHPHSDPEQKPVRLDARRHKAFTRTTKRLPRP